MRYLLRRWLAPQPTAPSCPSEPAGFGVEADGAIDSYVHLRMATLASTKHGLHGRNWATRFTYGWMTDLGVYCLSGKVCYRNCICLTVNDVGEPDEWRTSCPAR